MVHFVGNTLTNSEKAKVVADIAFLEFKCAKKSRLQEVSLNMDSSFLSWWKIVHFDPQERLEYEGLPAPVSLTSCLFALY